MPLIIPQHLAEKAAAFPASSDGGIQATLGLKNGRKIFHVVLARGEELVSINGETVRREDMTFGMTDIIDVMPGP
jgi:hypothetical protein